MSIVHAIRGFMFPAMLGAVLLAAGSGSGWAQAARNTLNTDAQIYLLRGLANVFSRGMDEMGATLTAQGFSPVVMNHRGWQNAADTIARNYQSGRRAPIILIGHSLGANSAYRIARRLNGKGIPVAYLATFDPTLRFTVPDNVRYFVNFYQNNGTGRRASFAQSRHKQKATSISRGGCRTSCWRGCAKSPRDNRPKCWNAAQAGRRSAFVRYWAGQS